MSPALQDYAQLLRDAVTQAQAEAPQVAVELRTCASQAAEAIATVTNGPAALDLSQCRTPRGAAGGGAEISPISA